MKINTRKINTTRRDKVEQDLAISAGEHFTVKILIFDLFIVLTLF